MPGHRTSAITEQRPATRRNSWSPFGLGRFRARCGVAAPQRWHRIACVASPYSEPESAPNATRRTSTTGC